MIAARSVTRALICSGAGSLTALVALQAGAWLSAGGPSATPAAVSASTAPVARGVTVARGAWIALPLLWALALLWGGLVTWLLRRLRHQTLSLYLGAGAVFGVALGALGLASVRWIGAQSLSVPRAATVIVAFVGGWLVGLSAYWRLRRNELSPASAPGPPPPAPSTPRSDGGREP